MTGVQTCALPISSWLVYCETDWLPDVARRLKELIREERTLRESLPDLRFDHPNTIQKILDEVKQIDQKIRDIGTQIITLLNLDEDPNIQKLRLRNATEFVAASGEGDPWYIQLLLEDKNKPDCSAKIRIERPPGVL